MLPSTGRQRHSDPWDSSWDAHRPPAFPTDAGETPESDFDGPRATSDSLVRAFASSNAAQALREAASPLDRGHGLLRTQHKHSAHDPHNPNILPTPVSSARCSVDEFYLGGLNVPSQTKSGRTFVDRLGNEFEIWESSMPLPDKDYSTTAPDTSRRNLERCQGGNPAFADRRKREAEDAVNPAEPRGDASAVRERKSALQLKSRAMFFNQAGMQEPAAFDSGRGGYDGYNVRDDKIRARPVQPCWRATLHSSVDAPAEPTQPSPRVDASSRPLRQEASAPYAQPARSGGAISAKSAGIALPFLRAASLRSKEASAGRGLARCGVGASAKGPDGEATHQLGHRQADAVMPARPAKDMLLRTNPAVQASETAEMVRGDMDVGAAGPQQLAPAGREEARNLQREGAPRGGEEVGYHGPTQAAPTLAHDHAAQLRGDGSQEAADEVGRVGPSQMSPLSSEEHREMFREEGMPAPKPTALPVVARRIAEDVESLQGDDAELEQIYRRSVVAEGASPREDVDHTMGDVVALRHMRDADVKGDAGAHRAEVALSHGDDVAAPRARRADFVVAAGAADAGATRQGREETEQTYSAFQMLHASSAVPASVAVDDKREMAKPSGDRGFCAAGRLASDARATGQDAALLASVGRADSSVYVAGGRAAHDATDPQRDNAATALKAGRARPVPSSPVRSKQDALPTEDRASVCIRPRRDGSAAGAAVRNEAEIAATNRSLTHREAMPARHALFATSDPRAALDKAPADRGPAFPRTNAAAYEHRGAPVASRGQREETHRSTFGAFDPSAKGAVAGAAAMRAVPLRSNAVGGTERVDRLETRSNQAADHRIVAAEPSAQRRDRSTPTRALTPSVATSARWTPTVQFESRREARAR